jgi:Mbeg1-like
MADLADIAYLSAFVYGPGDTTLPNGGTAPPPGWVALGAPDSISGDKFYAQAFKNSSTNEIVIAVRGTVPSLVTNLFSDAALTIRLETAYAQDAINYAISIARQNPTSALTLTGHSLGGYAAQAALARLVDSGISPSASAVVFNAPGITNAYFNGIASNYNAYSFDTQGDIINGAGGVHLGQTATINVGPSATDEWQAFKTGFGNATALLASLYLGTKSIAAVVLQAHSMDNFTNYFGGSGGANTIGSKTAAQFMSAGLGSSPSSLIHVDSVTGAATIADGSGDALTLQSPGNQLLNGSLTLAAGAGLIAGGTLAGLQSELAADGSSITIPTYPGSIPAVFGSTIPNLYESTGVKGTGTAPFIVGTNASDLGIAVSDQQFIPIGSTGSRLEFNVPALGQLATETIEGGSGNGSVWVNGASGYGQLTGGPSVHGVLDKWVDANGTTYTFQGALGSAAGTLTISSGLLGANPANAIVINGFDLGAATTQGQGFLGISLPESVLLSPGANTGSTPRDGIAPEPSAGTGLH